MKTLLELLSEIRRLDQREAIRFCNGFRTWKLSYKELYARLGGFADYLNHRGFQRGDRLLLWGENRPEWVAVFWGCLARGVEVIPVDYRFSPGLVKRIQEDVKVRLLVHGETVPAGDLQMERLSFNQIEEIPQNDRFELANVSPADVVEIVYTSGTTGEPKGVVHRHKNICANLQPFQKEINRYKKWARPMQPLRILNMLPLSHMFAQSMGLFIPVLLEGAAVFMLELHPGAIREVIGHEKVSVLVSVPRLLANLQKDIERKFDLSEKRSTRRGFLGALGRWWRFRHVHASLGWKFWALVVGGARVDLEIEAFWSRLGFLVLQGYGMTETSPVVTVNHPFNARPGSIGTVLEGQEVKIAPDGEILVRGESVVREYLKAGKPEPVVAADGWLHTGDIGEIDEEGHLYYKGRKKDVIVTSEGLNVHPEDVEVVLARLPEINEGTVIGLPEDGGEVIHAVLILRNGATDAEPLVHKANEKLEAYQRIRSWSIWPEQDLPRTASTLKVKRAEVASRVAAEISRDAVSPEYAKKKHIGSEEQSRKGSGLEATLARMTAREPSALEGGLRLSEDLGLSSLERVDLLSHLENQYGVELDEETFVQLTTIKELKEWLNRAREKQPAGGQDRASVEHTLVRPSATAAGVKDTATTVHAERSTELEAPPSLNLPRWSRFLPVRWCRLLALEGAVLPLFRHYIDLSVEGIETLEAVKPPVIFAANHASHLDTPAIFASLPFEWRYRLAPAMAQEYFRAYFQPHDFPLKEILAKGFQYYLASALFNAYPLPQVMGGVRRVLKYTGELTDRGYCPLVYPEGLRSLDGTLQPFKPGIGLMALRLRVPVVPIHLDGMFDVYSVHHDWPQSAKVRVRIGGRLKFQDGNYEEATRQIEKAIHTLRD